MRKILLFSLFLVSSPGFAQMPTGIGGFELNTDVEQYKGDLKVKTTLPIRFMEGISEVEIQRLPGYKSGYIAYGTCAAPGKVVRIKLKYIDASKRFYEKLLKAYKDKFGKPQWLGDPFHVISTWKWVFKDGNERVELYLQHNISNKDEKFGNTVKMTMTNLLADELACFAAKNPDFRKSNSKTNSSDTIVFDDLVPE